MAKLTDEYISTEFYRRFYSTSPERQRGIIDGLLTILRAQSVRTEQKGLPFPEPTEEAESVAEEPEAA